jgi:hypothetical protein
MRLLAFGDSWTAGNGVETDIRYKEKTNNVITDGHFGEYGHIAQAKYFYNFIKKCKKC